MADSLHVTKGCQSQRNLCIGSQFPEEPERDQFIFHERDLFMKLKEDVRNTKEAYQDYFKTPVPLLDEDGKLVQKSLFEH